MTLTTDQAALDQWYVLGALRDFPKGETVATRLLGGAVNVTRRDDGIEVIGEGRALPVRTDYQHLWTSFGAPAREVFALPEAAEVDRRWIYCGGVHVRASGLRLIENFLDLAHFPYVHTDILGSEAKPEVAKYDVEQRRGDEEVSLAWVAGRLQEFVDTYPEFEIPVERFATWLARLDDPDDE